MTRTSLPVVTDCQGCGACCTAQAGLPVTWYCSPYGFGDASLLPPALLAELDALLASWRLGEFPPDGSPCVWYDADSRRCRRHEHRPQICKDLAVGGDGCRRWRKALGIDPQPRWSFRGGRLVRTGA